MKVIKTIKVKSCSSCPFCNNDNEYGLDACNLGSFTTEENKEMPSDTVHDKCPLKGGNITVVIK